MVVLNKRGLITLSERYYDVCSEMARAPLTSGVPVGGGCVGED